MAAHAGHSNSRRTCWSGTTETKSPQELLLARVPTIVMDILDDFLLARGQRFLNNHFHRHHHFHCEEAFHRSSSHQLHAVGIKFMLLCLYRKGTSRVQYCQVRPRLCHSTFLWRLACEISQQVHSVFSWDGNLVTFEPGLMFDEISKIRIVQDIEITSIVQFHSLDSTSKQCALTQSVKFTRPISGC